MHQQCTTLSDLNDMLTLCKADTQNISIATEHLTTCRTVYFQNIPSSLSWNSFLDHVIQVENKLYVHTFQHKMEDHHILPRWFTYNVFTDER